MSIPVTEAQKYSDGGESVVYMPEQILSRKATEYKNNKSYDLAIACLKKVNELYPHSFYTYTRDDYERLVDMMILAGRKYMQIVEYENKYLENIKDLLVELEEYIVSIDKDHLDHVHPEYREKMAVLDLEEVNKNNGKCYLAVENNKAIGLIMGCIFPYDEYDYLDYKCPKRGEITELIVTNKIRSKGIGQELINKMEEYFKSVGCEYVIVDVFAYNDIGKNFYNKKDYHARMETMIKKI